MSEVKAPDWLWADWDYDANDGVCGVHTKKKYASGYEPDAPPIEFIRADLHADAIRQARNEALREAAEVAENHPDRVTTWSSSRRGVVMTAEAILALIDKEPDQ
ncbi:MAG: hypothetical protein EP341_09610 [Sphingomonadales bacterium]|nr:MAG: hypothetical protein EP341_09610 [Sphingomonadales bacterium]